MKRFFATAVLAAAVSGPAFAQGYSAGSGLRFTPLENGVRIQGETGQGARGTWCAAAEYMQAELGARGNQDIYVSDPRPRGFGKSNAVSFTLDPTGLTPSDVFIVGLSLTRKGARLSVDHALTFCADLRLPSR